MNLLEKHFDLAFAAPDGIQKLRELILTLAMQGKLVPQDSNDQPASELLRAIEVEKQRLVKKGKIKQSKPLPEIKPEEVPYELPKGWEWVRLHNYGIWKSGTTPSRNNSSYYGGGIPWVKSGEVKQGRIIETSETITQEALKSCSLDLNSIGSVLVAMYGANIGDVGVLEIEATTNQAVCACKPYPGIDNIFLKHLLISLKQNFITQGAGAAQPNISREKIIYTIVPLPPFAEQRRIVAKIDRLMARCDELEKLRAERNQKRITIHTAALNRLLSSSAPAPSLPPSPSAQSSALDSRLHGNDGDASSLPRRRESSALDCGRQGNDGEFAEAWRFITQHFGELYSVKENVAELRKAILQLAVMGKLVPQDPNDEPASELLRAIDLEKQRLVKEGKIKTQKLLPKINPEEIPYSLPKSWKWVRTDDFCVGITSGSTPPNNIFSATKGIPFLKVYNIRDQKVDFQYKSQFIDEEYHAKAKRSCLKPGDVLMNIVGPPLGKVAIVPDDFPEYNCNQAIVFFRPVVKDLNKYLYLYLVAGKFLDDIDLIGTAGQDNISVTKSRSIPIPIPPLAEQHRIVAKVDQLMNLCDRLEGAIAAAQAKQTDLLNAVMTQV